MGRKFNGNKETNSLGNTIIRQRVQVIEGKIAVMKKGRKSAVKLYDVDKREEAEFHAEQKNDHYIEERLGRYARCEGNFCGVNQFCNQWKGAEL